MIGNRCIKNTKKYYCCEDISLIENYDKAINDLTEKYDCHHRLEIQGDKRFSVDDLKEMGLYFNRPASELIFLTRSEHRHLHFACKGYRRGHIPWNKGKTGYSSKPHKKYKWMTPDGSIVEMVKNLAKMHHPDWKLIE